MRGRICSLALLAVGAALAQQQNVTRFPDSADQTILVPAGDNANKALRVNCITGCAGGGGGGGDVNITGINGVVPSVGTGVAGTGTLRVVLPDDQPAITIQGSLTNISGTVSLPVGAATAAKQPALGTAGSASADVITVQGVASMTPLLVNGSGFTQPVSGTVTSNIGTTNGLALDATVAALDVAQGSTTSGQQGFLIQGAVTTAAPSYTNAQTSPFSLTTAGALRVDASASTQPVSGTVTVTQATAANLKVDLSDTAANATSINVACTSGCTPGGSFNDDSAFTFGTTAINVSGYVFDDTSPNAVTENNAAAPRMSGNRVPYGIIRDAAGNERGANVTAGNALVVDGSASTQPISGTVTATQSTAASLNATVVGTGTFAVQAAQSGTWNITNISGTVSLPTGASTLAEQQTQTTALQLIDDAIYASDAALSKIVGLGAQFDDTTPGTTTENNVRPLRMSTRRELYSQIRDAAGNERGVNVTAGNALVVDGSASTQPVSGTVTANQGGTWNITNVSGTVSLPTGASTLAEQQTQTTALQLIDNIVHANDAAIASTAAIGAQFDDTTPGTTTENSVRALRMSTRRELYSQIRDAAGNERGANVNASNQLSVSVDNTVTVASHAITNAGTFAVQESGAALTALQLIDDVVYTDDTSTHTTGTSKGGLIMAVAAPTDTSVNANDIAAVAMTVDREMLVTLPDGVALNAGTNLIGEAVSATTATTANSASTCYITSAASTNSTNCKASAGNVYGYSLVNTTSTIYYLRMYNASSAPTCSSATGFVESIPVPHGTATGGGVMRWPGVGQAFATGIGFCLTGGGSSTDNTNAATGVYVAILYK